ncbi:hypothetical protein BKI52_19290 [marine bacterium AO1-C]|nr:hypothetical protein BKI52_19290 [marine bacterium AO1-C]
MIRFAQLSKEIEYKMKTNFQKYILSKRWLLVFFLLLLVQVNEVANATDRDSLQKVHIEASIKLLNRAITHNTLKKPTTATRYLVDRLNYVSADAREKIEKVLEYLQKTTGKELYVIITRNPDLVNEGNAKTKFQKEIKDYSQAVFKGSMLDEKGGLYTFNFGRIIQKARIGTRQSFQHGVSLANGSSWKNEEILNEQTIRTLHESSKSLNEKDDFLKANLYALVSKVLNAAGEEFNIDLTSSPSHQKNIEFEATILGTSTPNATGSALIVDLPVEIVSSDQQQKDKLKANYVFTPSGQAIYWGGMTKKKFWKSFNGSLLEFTHDKTRYVAIMSRPQFTGGDNSAYTRFWGYYPKGEYQRLKTLEGDSGLPLAEVINKKSVLSKEFKDNLWFKIKAAEQPVKVYARKYKGVDLDPKDLFSESEIESGVVLKNLTFKTNCIEAYAWSYTPSVNTTTWGRGTIQEDISIPSNSEKRVGNCETQKLIEEDVKNRNLLKGFGVYVYAYQIQEVKSDETQRQALVKYANEVSTFLQNKYVGLLNFEQKFEGRGNSGNYYTIQREQILLALRKLSPDDFKATYPKTIDKARVNGGGIYEYKILTQYNPFTEGYSKRGVKVYQVPANYNQNTRDYTIKGKKKEYHYSVQDLAIRHQIFANAKVNLRFSNQLLQDEKAGNAYPLSLADGTDQNKALFGSNSAIFTWFQFATSTGKYVVQEACKIIRGFADQLVKDISVAELPKHWWNPACELRQPKKGQDNCNACKSTYSSIFAKIFSVFPEGIDREEAQMEFAFYAGLWNGIVGQVKGVFQLVSLAAGYVSDPKVRKAVQDMKDNLRKKGLWTVIGEEVNKATCNKFVASYSTGKLVIDIATMVLGAPKATAKMLDKVKRLKNFVSGQFGQIAQGTLKVLNKVKQISARLGQGVIKIAKSTAQGAKDVFRILAKSKGKNIDEVIAVVDNGKVKVNKWVDATQNTKSISKESLDGTHHLGETPGGEVGVCLKNGVCFIAGTPIYYSSGQFKPIENIRTGDQVYSGNPENCIQRPKGVEVTFVRTTPVLIKLGFLQENIYATPEHPFFDLKNKQILAGNLKKGDTLKTYDGYAIVQHTRSIDTTTTVYNFHVKDFQTYYVGKTKLWVHNMASHNVPSFFKVPDKSLAKLPKIKKHRENVGAQVGDEFGAIDVKIKDNKIYKIEAGGKEIPMTDQVDFVVTMTGELKLGTGHYFLSGSAATVRAAGQIKIVNGKITLITNGSGHYRPNANALKAQKELFDDLKLTDPKCKVYDLKWAPRTDVIMSAYGIDKVLAEKLSKLKNFKDFFEKSPELLKPLSNAEKKMFLEDLTKTTSTRTNIGDKVKRITSETVEAWRVQMGDANMRVSLSNLKEVTKYLKENPGKFEKIKKGFDDASDKQKYISRLNNPVKSKMALINKVKYKNIEYHVFRDKEGGLFVKFDNGGVMPSGKPKLKTLGRGSIKEDGVFGGQLTMKNQKTGEYWHPDIRGSFVLKTLIDTEIAAGKSFKVFKASWNENLSDNLQAFNKGLRQGLSKAEAAKRTWTGQWLDKNYKLDKLTDDDISGILNADGLTYSKARVRFNILQSAQKVVNKLDKGVESLQKNFKDILKVEKNAASGETRIIKDNKVIASVARGSERLVITNNFPTRPVNNLPDLRSRGDATEAIPARLPDGTETNVVIARTRKGPDGEMVHCKPNGKRSCFVAGTLIQTCKGLKKIEKVKLGDLVWSYNTETKKKELRKVTQTFIRSTQQLVYLYLGKDTIKTTTEHPFYLEGKWVKAGNLNQGDSLHLYHSRKIALDSLVKVDTNVTVYNFTVAQNHNYYAGKDGVLVHNANGYDLLDKAGKFKDNTLENDYLAYVTRKNNAGKTARDRLDWKDTRDYWLHDSPMARGNKFNDKARDNNWYDFDEIYLENGKRLDSYDDIKGEIVSRKASDLDDISLQTFETYLQEMHRKYAAGTIIKSSKYPQLYGKPLQGKLILELPESNLQIPYIQNYINIAKHKHNIELRFRPED